MPNNSNDFRSHSFGHKVLHNLSNMPSFVAIYFPLFSYIKL